MTALAVAPQRPVSLRDAGLSDCESIWAWNFAPEVRACSRRAEVVTFVAHERWYARRLAEIDAPIWVIQEYRAPVGVVRIDPVDGGRARISIALAGDARGRRIGSTAIAMACRRWGRPIAAEILAANLASRACFETCGFRSIVACDDLLTYHWDPET